MFNLLPEKEKKIIRRQYRMRKIIVILGFLSFIIFSSLIFLIPSYVLTLFKVQEMKTEISIVKNDLIGKNHQLLEEQVTDLNRRIKQVSLDQENPEFHDLIDKVLSEKPREVRVTGFLLQEVEDPARRNTFKIQMTGVSDTRSALVKYTDILEETGLYGKVDLPIESLASQFDTDFNLNLTFSI